MSLTATIGTMQIVIEGTFSLQDQIDQRSRFGLTVLDQAGTALFQKGQPVEIVDSILGTIFTGYVNQPQATLLYPSPQKMWALQCVDNQYLLDKRTSDKTYANQYAGTIVADQIQRYGSAEGVSGAFALDWDELESDWQAGTLTGVVATTNVSDGNPGDGDLELAPAGTAVTFQQETQADFNAGTGLGLTSPATGGVTFTPTQAIQLEATMSVSGLSNAYIYVKIWDKSQGTYTIPSTFPTLFYDLWIADSSPQQMAGVEVVCTDGTSFLATASQWNAGTQGITATITNNLSDVAKNQWFIRGLPMYGVGSLSGKTVDHIALVFAGNSQGTYTAYFRNIKIAQSDGVTNLLTVLSGTATTIPVPPQQLQDSGYSAMACTLVTTYEQHGSMLSPVCSLAAAGIVKSSYVSWDITLPSSDFAFSITASIDIPGSGTAATFLPCTQNGAIPGLLPGMNLTNFGGMSVVFVYVFDNSGNDPTLTPLLSRVAGGVQPAYASTKMDVVSTTHTQALWNAGTLTNLVSTSAPSIALNGYARNWDDANYASQTLYGSASPAQGINQKQFFLTSGTGADARSRFDFAGSTWQNFTMEVDVTLTSANVALGMVYRCVNWGNSNDSYAYSVTLNTTSLLLGRGSNSTGAGAFTQISLVSLTLSTNTTYHLKIIVNGSNHQVFVNDVRYINATDSTYSAGGYVGLRLYNASGSTQTGVFDNFGIMASLSGTWVSPAIDIHMLGTLSNSQIIVQIDPATSTSTTTIQVEISLNNGSTWTTCPNVFPTPIVLAEGYFQSQPVPGLLAGTNVSGMTQVLLRLTIASSTASTGSTMPDIQAVTFWAIGAYSSTGTRSTAPIAWDSMQRANVASGWGPANSGQTYTQAGTGTTNLTSNEAQIANTTGDVHMQPASASWTDEETTVRFSLSASALSAGAELRYVNSNNFYRCSATTTTLTLARKVVGVSTTLATTPVSLATGTFYHLRFNVSGAGPVLFQARLWQDGTPEPTTWTITYTDPATEIGQSSDTFIRPNQSGWGTASNGEIWSQVAGSDVLAIVSDKGQISSTSGSANDRILLGSAIALHADARVRITVGSISDGPGLVLRSDGTAANHYFGRLSPGNPTRIEIGKRIAGTGIILGVFPSGITVTTGSLVWLRLKILNSTLSIKAWLDGTAEPTGVAGSLTDTTFASAGQYGIYCSGQPVAAEQFDSFQVSTIPLLLAGSCALYANGTGTVQFDTFLVTPYPDPRLVLLAAGRATTSLLNWNANTPTNTSLAVATSVDNGVSWQPVANPGDAIPNVSTMAHYQAIRTRSPLAFYRLNERSGLEIFDSSNNGNGVALGQIADLTLGQPGTLQGLNETDDTSILFNGTSGWIDLTTALNGNGLSAFSFAGWFQLSTAALGSFTNLLFSGTSTAHTGYQLYWSSTTSLNFVIGNGTTDSQVSYATSPVAGAWMHLVGTYDGTNVKFYVNGVLRGTTAQSGVISASAVPVLGASTTHTQPFPGSVQGVAFFASALQQADVTAIYTAGVAATQIVTEDIFAVDSSADYTQSNFGGATGAWTWDTANSRLVGSGGTNGTLVNSIALSAADNQILADFDECDGSGLIANAVDASDCYFVQIWDGSGTGTQNSVKLFKRSGGTNTQLGSTVAISFPRGSYRRFILDVQAGVLTVSMDGVQLLQQTDGSPLGSGNAGLLLNTLARCYGLRIQQYAPDVSSITLATKFTLTSSDPTATPQILDAQTFVSSPSIGPGVLIPSAKYQRTFVSANVDDCTKQSNYWSNVLSDASVLFQPRNAVPAPWVLASVNKVQTLGGQQIGDIQVANLQISNAGDLYRNRQILTGAIATAAFVETKVGDGQTRTWNVAHALSAPPTSILLNGQMQTFGVKGIDTGKQFYYQIASMAIDQDSSQTILQEADSLVVSYTGSYSQDVTRDNTGQFPGTISQAQMAAIDQSSGIVEAVEDVSSKNMTVEAAEVLGDQYLQRYGNIGRTLNFTTTRPGLAVGQQLSCMVPELNLNNVQLLITAITITINTSAAVTGGLLYWYAVTATEGPNLGSWVKLFASVMRN